MFMTTPTVNASSAAQVKLSQQDFVAKITKDSENLKTGKMWLNDKNETQNKDSRIVRWIKCILSVILPFNLYSSIKVDRVALNYFGFINTHKEYLGNQETREKAIEVFKTLKAQTKDKYVKLLEVYEAAIQGIVPSAIESATNAVKDVKDAIAESKFVARFKELFKKNESKPDTLAVDRAFEALNAVTEQEETKDLILSYAEKYETASLERKEEMVKNLSGMAAEYAGNKKPILDACTQAIKDDIKKAKESKSVEENKKT